MKKNNILKIALWIIPMVILLLSIIFPNAGIVYLINLLLSFVEVFLIIFNFKEKNNSIRIVMVIISCFILLTWLIPAAHLSSGEYIKDGRIQMGLFDLANYPMTVVSYFGYIAFYILAVGAFYGILNIIPAYRVFLDKVAKLFKGTEKFALFLIMLILAVLTSIGGMQLALLCLFPMLVSIIILMGFDKMVAALILVGSTMIGIAGTTYGYSNVSIISQALGTTLTSEMITKVVILIVGLILLYFNTLMYIKKQESNNNEVIKEIKKKSTKTSKEITKGKKENVKKKSSSTKSTKSTKAAKKNEEVIVVKEQVKQNNEDEVFVPEKIGSGKHNIWPFTVCFVVLFINIILAFMPWIDAFGLKAFDDATSAVVEFELFGFPIFSKLFGTMNAFGYWSIIDLLVILLVIILLLSVIYKIKFNNILDGALDGIKKALPLSILVILAYTCLVIVVYNPFQLEVYNYLLSGIKKVNILSAIVLSLTSVISSILNVESAYAFQAVLPYFTTVVTETSSYPIVAIIFQSIYGFTMLFAPTSVILMLVLSYLNIPYSKWLKNIWKLLLELLAVIFVVVAIMILF